MDSEDIPTFHYSPEDFIFTVKASKYVNKASKFDEELKKKWCKARDDGFFRYHLDKLRTEIIPGRYKFVSQLNVKRAEERRKPEYISSITEPFNPGKFNFTKIKSQEVLYFMKNDSKRHREDNDKDVIIINVSPLEYCHSLLLSSLSACHPQIILAKGIKLTVETVLLSATSSLKIGFNSLGAYASVNHHHFHLYYLEHDLYIETAPVEVLSGSCHVLTDFPAPAFVFELKNKDIEDLTNSVMKLVDYCMDNSIPHNIMMTRGASLSSSTPSEVYDAIRVYFWGRKAAYGSKNDFAFNPAVCELAGHLPIKVESMFTSINEEDVSKVLAEVCLDTFNRMKDDVKKLFS